MKPSGFSSLIKLMIPAFEQNTSSIEKLHTRFKATRFVGGNIIFIASLLIVSVLEYLAFNYWAAPFIHKISPALIMAFIGIFISTRFNGNFFKVIGFHISNLSLIFLFSAALIEMGYDWSKESSRFELVLPMIFISVLIAYVIYSTFNWSKSFAIYILQQYLNSKYVLTIELINSTVITGEVLTITRKNDYILKLNEDDKEILIKGSSVASVKLIDQI